MANENKDIIEIKKGFPIEFFSSDETITPLATNIVVQIMEGVFKISFFEIKPPIQLDESVPPPSKIRADCVGSVFITPDKLKTYIDVLQRQLDKYLLQNKKE